jgi:hypothetical protein
MVPMFRVYSSPTTYAFIGSSASGFLDTVDNFKFMVTISNGTVINLQSKARLRDFTNHVHLHVVLDTTQAVAADRAVMYINGVRVTEFDVAPTYPAQNADVGLFNGANNHVMGEMYGYYSDWYQSCMYFVGGQSLPPTDFGYKNTQSNEWVLKTQAEIKAKVDAGGTNSTMLNYSDATSLTTLGNDYSVHNNDWTLSGFSLTAGPFYDHHLDVPGNSYATLNPLKKFPSNFTTWSNGNLQVSENSSSQVTAIMTQSIPASGKWYFECHMVDVATNGAGVGSNTVGVAPESSVTGTGHIFNTGSYRSGNPILNLAGVAQTAGATYTSGDVIGVAVDQAAGSVQFYKNGVAQGATPSFTFTSGTQLWPFVGADNVAGLKTYSMLFGQAPLHASATYHSAAGGYFRYTPPTGFKALCQRNLPDPAILNPEKHFDVVTRMGFGASGGTISGLPLSPEFVWGKERNAVSAHNLVDKVRGGDKLLFSNLTNAETTVANFITGFNADGYTLGSSDYATTSQVVEWLWKMGGAAVTNNNGSISSQVSANVLAGQSVVTYTGNNVSGHTVGHGLSSSPNLVIIKSRGNTEPWPVYHASAGFGNQLFLNTTAAQVAPANGYVGVVSSTTFSVNGAATNSNVNSLGVQYVALCFHSVPGYSKVGSYIGNGSADGPYVECGFKPAYLTLKGAGNASNWNTFDGERSPSNLVDDLLRLNLADAENVSGGTSIHVDFTATGFKIRGSSVDLNSSGVTYIFYAVADVAGKYALGR